MGEEGSVRQFYSSFLGMDQSNIGYIRTPDSVIRQLLAISKAGLTRQLHATRKAGLSVSYRPAQKPSLRPLPLRWPRRSSIRTLLLPLGFRYTICTYSSTPKPARRGANSSKSKLKPPTLTNPARTKGPTCLAGNCAQIGQLRI